MPGPEPIGRDGVVADLVEWFGTPSSVRGRAALLLGDAGIGKSTVADAVADRVGATGFRVVRSWCSAAGMPPLWPWRRALGPVAPDLRFESGAAGPDDRAVLFAATIDALEGLSGPLLLVMDDVHWADPASLALLHTVADALPVLPVAMLVTARDEPTDARAALVGLPTVVRRVPVPPLDDAAAAVLARRVAPQLNDAQVDAVVGRSGGNPLFVTEVARLVASHGPAGLTSVPAGVREVLDRRLARLSQPAQRTLAVAAVLGETTVAARDPIDELLVANVAEVSAEVMTAHIDEAVRAGLVEPDPSGAARLRFTHALVREVLVAGLGRAELGGLHRRAAEAVEQTSGAVERLAYHWARAAGPDAPGRAARWSLAAGDAALAGLGYDQAVVHLRRALPGPGVDRVETLIRLGRAQRLAGDLAGSRQSFLDAAAQATHTADLVHAALGIGGGPIGFEVPIADDAQVGVLRRALAKLETDQGPMRAAVLGRLSLALTGLAAPGERRRLAEQAVAIASGCGDADVLVGALAAYCDAVAGPDYVDQRLDAASRMLAVATDHVPALLARRLRVLALLERGAVDEADREIDKYRWAADAVGLPLYQWLPLVWRGARALMQGDVEAAIRCAREAETVGRRADSFNAVLLGQSLRMHAHLTGGTADRIVTEIHALLDQVGEVPLPVTYRAAPAVLLLAAGDPGPARAALRNFLATPTADIAADSEWLEGHWALADAAITLGDAAAATRLLTDLRPYARLWAIDGIGAAVFGTISHQLGRLAGMLGQKRTAAEYLAQALADYERVGAARLAAQVRTEAGLPAPADVDHAEGSMLRDGPVWRVTWRGVAAIVPDSKGMQDLATLLSRANQPVPAIDLAGTRGAAGGLGEVLDPTARAAYRKRLAELDADIAAGSQSAERERDTIAKELAAATGLHGGRIAGDQTDRARKAVTMRIRAAIQAIEAVNPALARHLRNAIKTGRLCAYEPDIVVTWRI